MVNTIGFPLVGGPAGSMEGGWFWCVVFFSKRLKSVLKWFMWFDLKCFEVVG